MGKIQQLAIEAHEDILRRRGEITFIAAFAGGFEAGYKEAEKDIIALIESRISEILGDAQPHPALRAELQEIIKRIKEEEK